MEQQPQKPVLIIMNKEMMEQLDAISMRQEVMDNYTVITPKMLEDMLKNHEWSEQDRAALEQIEQLSPSKEGEKPMEWMGRGGKKQSLTNQQIRQGLALVQGGKFGQDVTIAGLNPPDELDQHMQEKTGRGIRETNPVGLMHQMKDRGMIDRDKSNQKVNDFWKHDHKQETSLGGFHIQHNLNRAWKKVSGKGVEVSWMSDLSRRNELEVGKSRIKNGPKVEKSTKPRDKNGPKVEKSTKPRDKNGPGRIR